MTDLPPTVSGYKAEQNESKTISHKACTHLKKLMDKVREVGKDLFRRNPNQYRGYLSQFWQKLNRNSNKENETYLK